MLNLYIWNPYLCHNINIKWVLRNHSDQTNKQERDRNPMYKQDHVLLFTVNKESVLSHMTIIMQMAVYQPKSPADQNLCNPSSMVLIFSKYL